MTPLKRDELEKYADMFMDYLNDMSDEEFYNEVQEGLRDTEENWSEIEYFPPLNKDKTETFSFSSLTAEYDLGRTDSASDNDEQFPYKKAA